MGTVEILFAAIGVIASVCGITQFVIALRYDRNTQTFIQHDLTMVLREALLCAFMAVVYGTMAYFALEIAWFIIGYLLVLMHPVSTFCAISPPGGDFANCLASAAFAPVANTIILVGSSLAAILGGGAYLTGLAQKWLVRHKKSA